MPHVFISYRRDDSAASAGRIFDRLIDRFGEENVFRDIDTIEPGAEFAEVIAEHIARCDALIAVIGREWLNARDAEGRRRLDDPKDFVRVEVREALRLNKLVIPALVEGVAMPEEAKLPGDIVALTGRKRHRSQRISPRLRRGTIDQGDRSRGSHHYAPAGTSGFAVRRAEFARITGSCPSH
jgi:TIR domain